MGNWLGKGCENVIIGATFSGWLHRWDFREVDGDLIFRSFGLGEVLPGK